jgi:hypothetical protein
MKIDFPTLEPGCRLDLIVSNGQNSLQLSSTLMNHVKDHIAIISIDHSEHALKFESVSVNAVYTNPEGIPYIWINVKVVFYQGQYLIQVDPNGGRRHNRKASFRVGVSKNIRMHIDSLGVVDAMVRDVSLGGFSVTDRKNEWHLQMGARGSIKFEDMGHELDLEGYVVRIDDQESYCIYGFVITRSCKDLSSYLSLKQRRNRN